MSCIQARPPRPAYVWIPREVHDMIRDRVLQPLDAVVLAALLRTRRRGESWSEAQAAAVADAVGVSPGTGRRSLGRLVASGVLDRRRVGPDRPGGRAGWRYHFPWIPDPSPRRSFKVVRPS